MSEKNKNITNKGYRHRLPLSTWLGYLLLLTLLLSSVTYAAYSSSATATATAQVAKYVVELNTSETSHETSYTSSTQNPQSTYTFSVSNFNDDAVCEVKTNYTIKITFPSALPTGTSFTLSKGTSPITGTQSGNTYTYTNTAFSFPANTETTHEYTLTFSVNKTGFQNAYGNDPQTLSGIKIDILSSQAD